MSTVLLALTLGITSACSGSEEAAGPLAQSAPPSATCRESMSEHQFITSVSADGRHFLDQNGNPVLVRGDSPWSGMADWSPQQAELYFANRDYHDFNASIMSLVGSVANGGPYDDGTTFDGIKPFVNNDITRWNERYWQRVESYVDIACRHGNTIFLFPIDGWTYDKTEFADASPEQISKFGEMVAERLRPYPNIMWMTGGDYAPDMSPEATGTSSDQMFAEMLDGIRRTGDSRPFSIELINKGFSAESPFWASRIDWNFVYSYYPTYEAVLDAYRQDLTGSPMPALFGEGNYEGENNMGDAPTTDETLRRQVLWSLTSGAAGDFAGSQDWLFLPGWERRLDTPAVNQIQGLRSLVADLRWWELVPDDLDPLIIAGRGTPAGPDDRIDVLESDYATAARTPDGTLALVYVPTQRTIQLDTTKLTAPYSAAWIDPSAPTGPRTPASIDATGRVETPGANAAGDQDWLLIIEAR